HAALGLSQLQRSDEMLERRRKIAERYAEAFEQLSSIKGHSGIVEGHAYHLYLIEVEQRKGLFDHLRSKGILVQVHYIPFHLMPYYQERGWRKGDLPNAERYYSRCLSLPIFPSLEEDERGSVIEEIWGFYGAPRS
ncbi:MAG: DegT/DnrJ/EryC1/StrS family aminotransferase, partial [Flavobacteriales bacterium]